VFRAILEAGDGPPSQRLPYGERLGQHNQGRHGDGDDEEDAMAGILK